VAVLFVISFLAYYNKTGNNQNATEITVPSINGNTIKVKNFYKEPSFSGYGGQQEFLIEMSNYIIYYDKPLARFQIAITHEPLQENRLQAEQTLLDKLGISREQACLLPLYLGRSLPEDGISADQTNYKLSFCPNSLPME
jgi:hypothetical protein